jgi:hypothetical protein
MGSRPHIEHKAMQTALIALGSRRRAYNPQEPYIAHLVKAAHTLILFDLPTECVQALFLHELPRLTDLDWCDLAQDFAPNVIDLAQQMSFAAAGCSNNEARKSVIAHYSKLNGPAQSAKAALLIDLAWQVFTHARDKAPWYFREMQAYANVMESCHPALRTLLKQIANSVLIHNRWPDPDAALVRNALQ